MDYCIRPVRWEDRFVIWMWRNDPQTRRMERSADYVGWDGFKSWLKRSLSDPNRCLLLADTLRDSLAISQFTLQADGAAAIGINLNPRFRGRQLAVELIENFITEARCSLPFKQLRANIRTENEASRRSFVKAGFQEIRICDGICVYERDFS